MAAERAPAMDTLLLVFALPGATGVGDEPISSADLLQGFGNPALITIMALLVVGQGLFQTGAIEGPTKSLVRSYGNRYYRKPIAVGPVGSKGEITVEWWKYAQGLTDRPVKGMLTGPYTIADWSFNEHYPSREAFVMDLARVVHDEAVALEQAGAKYIQIDEPAISSRPDEMEIASRALGIVTEGLKAYTFTHICYGEFDKVYDHVANLPVDNLDLEMANSNYALLKEFKEHPTNKGLQCIKGLTSAEAIYVDRLTTPLIRKDMSDPLRGHVSATKGSFDDDVWRLASWEEAEELIADRTAEIVKTTGGNSVGLYGSGQLTVEGQYLENIFMKGGIGSNTMPLSGLGRCTLRLCALPATSSRRSPAFSAPPKPIRPSGNRTMKEAEVRSA